MVFQEQEEAQDKRAKAVILVSLALKASRAHRVSLALWDRKVKYYFFLMLQRIKLLKKRKTKPLFSQKKVITFFNMLINLSVGKVQ